MQPRKLQVVASVEDPAVEVEVLDVTAGPPVGSVVLVVSPVDVLVSPVDVLVPLVDPEVVLLVPGSVVGLQPRAIATSSAVLRSVRDRPINGEHGRWNRVVTAPIGCIEHRRYGIRHRRRMHR